MADTGHNDGEVGRIANYYPTLFGMVVLSHFTATSLFFHPAVDGPNARSGHTRLQNVVLPLRKKNTRLAARPL